MSHPNHQLSRASGREGQACAASFTFGGDIVFRYRNIYRYRYRYSYRYRYRPYLDIDVDTDANTLVGYNAGGATTGTFNAFYGRSSGSAMTTGVKNTIVGSHNGNGDGVDIRATDNNVILSDGDGGIVFRADVSGNCSVGSEHLESSVTLEVRNGVTSELRVSGGSNTNNKVEIGYDNTNGAYLKGGSSGVVTLQFFVDNTSLAMSIAANDVISGDFNDTSDVALKENIIDLESATTKLKQLKPRTFDWKKTDKENGVAGFIAQEVEAVIPKAVIGTNYENSGDAGKAINTTAILAYAIKTIQELEARIATLEDA